MSRGEDVARRWVEGMEGTARISGYDRAALAAAIDAELTMVSSAVRQDERRWVLRLLGMSDLLDNPSDERLRMMRDALDAAGGAR